MAADTFGDFDQDDDYRKRVIGGLDPNSGIAGPNDGGFPSPAASAPQGGYDLEKFRKSWYGQGDVNNIQGWLDKNRDFTSGVTLRNEKAYDPSGRFIADLVGNYSGGDPKNRTAIFLDGIGSNGKPRGSGGGLTTVTSGQGIPGSNAGNPRVIGGPGGVGGPGGGTPPAANDFLTKIRQQIMERLGQMKGDPSLSDPALAAQSQAYRTSRERGAEQDRAAMAERAAANGTLQGGQSSGSFDTELRSIQEGKSSDIAGNDAELLGNEVMQRRAEVQSLMNMALQSGDQESARMLQMQLAKMDEAIRMKQLAESKRQFDSDLGYRNRTFDDQFGRQIGRDYEDDYWRRVLYGLGG